MINIHLFLIAIGLLIINTDLMVESSYIDEITDTNLRYLSMKNAKNATIDFRPYQEQIKSLREQSSIHKFHKDFSKHNERYENRKVATKRASKNFNIVDDNSGHVRYARMVNHKTSILLQRLRKHASEISDADRASIEQDLSKYRELEQLVAAQIHRVDSDFQKTRQIRNKEERIAYLQQLKQKRLAQRQDDLVVRQDARELFDAIVSRIDALVGDGGGGGHGGDEL